MRYKSANCLNCSQKIEVSSSTFYEMLESFLVLKVMIHHWKNHRNLVPTPWFLVIKHVFIILVWSVIYFIIYTVKLLLLPFVFLFELLQRF